MNNSRPLAGGPWVLRNGLVADSVSGVFFEANHPDKGAHYSGSAEDKRFPEGSPERLASYAEVLWDEHGNAMLPQDREYDLIERRRGASGGR